MFLFKYLNKTSFLYCGFIFFCLKFVNYRFHKFNLWRFILHECCPVYTKYIYIHIFIIYLSTYVCVCMYICKFIGPLFAYSKKKIKMIKPKTPLFWRFPEGLEKIIHLHVFLIRYCLCLNYLFCILYKYRHTYICIYMFVYFSYNTVIQVHIR